MNLSGSTRIKNPHTLQKWIDNGWYRSTIEEGYVFNPGCGRFREEKCLCKRCRSNNGHSIREVLRNNNLI